MFEAEALSNFFLKFAVSVSIFGVVILPVLLLKSDMHQIDFSFSNTLSGSLYAAICLLGIIAVFHPKKCEKTFMFKKYDKLLGKGDQLVSSEKIPFKAHHPDCKEFSANRIRIHNVVFCSACAGLLLGAIGAFVGALLHFFIGFNFAAADLRILLVGYAGMLLGLVQFKFRGYLKLLANALFVFGSLLTLVTVDLLGKNLFINLYVLGLIVFLLLTRILISEWNNKRICARCKGCELLN